MAKHKKGIMGFAIKSRAKKKCKFGVNKNTGKCLKSARRNN